MEENAQEIVPINPERMLNEHERTALTVFESNPSKYTPLGANLVDKYFRLFLQGISCSEIARINKLYLGQVVHARVQHHWDEKRREHVEDLLRESMKQLQQTKAESFSMITALIASVNQKLGDLIKRRLQGEEVDLGEFEVNGVKGYKELLNVMKMITGEDQKQTAEVHHVHEVVPGAAIDRPFTTVEARASIKAALAERKK